ncbi:MAG: flippase-like domain-containing protein [Amoebophilaceae bacterium]|nr:flippase-like domain-containing protein [Amoebophilaceae bacterium]
MEPDAKKVFTVLDTRKIWWPIVIGVGVVLCLFVRDDSFSLAQLSFIGQADWRYLFLVLLAVIVRDVGYIYRIRLLTHANLSWLSSFYIIVLWEFSSAVTPSVVGGGFVAIFLLLKSGMNLGRSLAYVIVTSIFPFAVGSESERPSVSDEDDNVFGHA